MLCICVRVLLVIANLYFPKYSKVLLEHGADVNLQDEYSSVYRVAWRKKYDSYAGM